MGVSSANRAPLIGLLLYVLLTFTAYVVWRAFMAERSSDEAYFENCLWNATHGNGFRTWIEGGGRHHFALHFSPILYLLVPLYAIAPSMHVVHLVVALSVAGAGWVVYHMARESLGARTALFLMLSFLLNPTVVLQTFMEFHEQALVFFPCAMLLREFRAGRARRAALWGVVVASVREDNVLLLAALALVSLGFRQPRMAGALLAVAVGWLALCAEVALKGLGSGRLSHLFVAAYGVWGNTPGLALRAMLEDPGRVLQHLFSRASLVYLAQLLGPFLVILPFGSLLALAVLPQLLLLLLADHGTRLLAIRMHYSIVPVMILSFATIAALGRWSDSIRMRPETARRQVLGFALAMLAITATTVPFWLSRALGRLHPDTPGVRTVMAMVRDTASVTAPGYVLNHMADRRMIAKTWSGALTYTEYVILEARREWLDGRIDLEVPFSQDAAATLTAAGYHEIHAADGWHVWRRPEGPVGPPTRW